MSPGGSGTEIERKFLVNSKELPALPRGRRIVQGYLSIDPEVRVRIHSEAAVLTVKGPGEIEREEIEIPIPRNQAWALLRLTSDRQVEKTRYELDYAGQIWELDEYHGRNTGLWIAEIELRHPEEAVERPQWLRREVTHDKRYRNSQLATVPWAERDEG